MITPAGEAEAASWRASRQGITSWKLIRTTRGVGPADRRSIASDRFPHASKTHQEKVAAKRHPILPRGRMKKVSFKWPWLHFQGVTHSSARGFSASFRRCNRSRCGAFAVRLTVDDELMSTMAEAVQGALGQERFIKDSHPFLHASIRGENRGTASVAFDQQIVEVGGSLAGEFSKGEVIDDQ